LSFQIPTGQDGPGAIRQTPAPIRIKRGQSHCQHILSIMCDFRH
jgi:hypothetical protein